MADTAVNTRQVGRVKWFNNQSGYGFLTYTSSTGDEDVFVHHSALVTSGDQFRYLVQGEYVEFETTEVDNGGTPRVVAKDVRGMNGGMLMCETRHERRQSQQQRRDNNDSQADSSSTGSNRQSQQRSRPRFRGGGPRVGDRLNVGGTEWTLVRGSNNSGNNNRRGRPNKRSRTDDHANDQ